MNIIFGEALDALPDNYTVLELDTFVLPPDGAVRTFASILVKLVTEVTGLFTVLTLAFTPSKACSGNGII